MKENQHERIDAHEHLLASAIPAAVDHALQPSGPVFAGGRRAQALAALVPRRWRRVRVFVHLVAAVAHHVDVGRIFALNVVVAHLDTLDARTQDSRQMQKLANLDRARRIVVHAVKQHQILRLARRGSHVRHQLTKQRRIQQFVGVVLENVVGEQECLVLLGLEIDLFVGALPLVRCKHDSEHYTHQQPDREHDEGPKKDDSDRCIVVIGRMQDAGVIFCGEQHYTETRGKRDTICD